MTDAARGDWPSRVFASTGGLMFAGALGYFVWSYGWRFDDISAGAHVGTAGSIVVDLGLFTGFALHHSIAARPRIKAWMRSWCPAALERSVYVWIASLLLIATCALWQPVPGAAWHVDGATAQVMSMLQLACGLATIVFARRLDVLELAGIRQAARNPAHDRAAVLDTSGPYALVRHPVYFAWVLAVWLAPVMTLTRLVFAAVSTAYLVAAIPFEERDLTRTFGRAYGDYQRHVRWKLVPFVY